MIAAPVSGLPPGYLMATVFVNGIPSAGQIFQTPTSAVLANLPGQMLPLCLGPGGVTVSFAGIPGLTYTVQRAPALAGPWSTMATVTVGDSGICACLDSNAPADKAFYRISR